MPLNRAARVTLTRLVGTTPTESIVIDAGGADDLHVKFDVKKTDKKEPNTCVVTIDNLNEASRAFSQTKPLEVRLDVGHEDTPLGRLFKGDMVWGFSRKLRSGWETTIECADGQRKFKDSRICKSYKKGARADLAFSDIIASMGLVAPSNITTINTSFLAGLTVDGNSADELTRLLARVGLEWSVLDGNLEILSPTAVKPGLAILVSKKTGMISVPELNAPENEKKDPILDVRMILDPRANPGTKMILRSRSLSGSYKIIASDGIGDTRGGEWETQIEGRLLV